MITITIIMFFIIIIMIIIKIIMTSWSNVDHEHLMRNLVGTGGLPLKEKLVEVGRGKLVHT